MNEALIRKLAAHFTGHSVEYHSMNLCTGGHRSRAAHEWFKLRDEFGVLGCDSVDDAAKEICKRLAIDGSPAGIVCES